MSEYVKVGELTKFREGRGTVVKFQGKDVAVFNMAGQLMAIQDGCPHQGASLGDGEVRDGRVVCHRHGWAFDLTTGLEAERARCTARIYDVKLSDGMVSLRLRPAEDEGADDDDDWPIWDDSVHLKSS